MPSPASNRNTLPPTTTAVAGPITFGSGRGVPVPSVMITVDSGVTPVDVCARETKMGQHAASAIATIRMGVSGLDADEYNDGATHGDFSDRIPFTNGPLASM